MRTESGSLSLEPLASVALYYVIGARGLPDEAFIVSTFSCLLQPSESTSDSGAHILYLSATSEDALLLRLEPVHA